MQKSSELSKPNLTGPLELSVNGVEIETIPHLNFVDCISWCVIDSCRPVLFVIPIPSLLLCPSTTVQ
jgi:hypothetical protein